MRRAWVMAVLLALFAEAEAQPKHAPDPLVANNCLQCHSEEMLEQQRLTAKQWAAVVKKMQGWGAPVEAENVDALVTLLAAAYGPSAGPYKLPPIDRKTAEAAFAAQPDGKLKGGVQQKGQALYQTACLSCHGADGHGTLTGMNLADRPLLYRAAEFAATTRAGRGRMPAFAALTDADLASLLKYLRTL